TTSSSSHAAMDFPSGENAMEKNSPSLPVIVHNSSPEGTLHSFISLGTHSRLPSRISRPELPVASVLPSGARAIARSHGLISVRVRNRPVGRSHRYASLIWRAPSPTWIQYPPPPARVLPSGVKATWRTLPRSALKVCFMVQLGTSHSSTGP